MRTTLPRPAVHANPTQRTGAFFRPLVPFGIMTRHNAANRVLIIDDDLMSREVLTLLLGSEGFEAESELSGDAAVHHLTRAGSPIPAIILADMQMPGLTGAALAQALRRICPPPTLLVAMSASVHKTSAVGAFDAFLLKPFRAHQLVEVIEARRDTKVLSPNAETEPMQTPPDPPAASNPDMSTNPSSSAFAPNPVFSPASGFGPELDGHIYSQLQQAMPAGQLRQMYNLCVDDVRRRIADMRSLAARREADPFKRQAHAIKGGCGMLGASELYAMASQLEKAGLNAAGLDGTADVNPLDELTAACDRLERILGTRT